MAALLLTGCGGTSGAGQTGATPTPPDCTGLRFPYPDADLSLSQSDSGKTAMVHRGGLVEVDLLGAPDRHWTSIQLSGSGLQALSTQAMTPTVGSRLGEYCAATGGAATLASSSESGNWTATIKIQ